MKKITKLLIFIIVVLVLVLANINIGDKDKNTNKKDKLNVKEVKNKTIENAELILLGSEEMTIVKNGVYEEYGAKAIVNKKDKSKDIKIKGKIDTSKVGEQNITYQYGNKKVTRKVNIIEVTDLDTDGIPVLMYHYFYDDTAGESGSNSNYMRKSSFEQQLKYLSENNYYFPSMKELNLYLDGKIELPSKSVILTLDDGEESNYRIAYPLAVQYKVPLYWFVVTSWTDTSMEYQQELKNTGYINYLSHTDSLHHGGCGEQHGGALLCVNHDEGVKDLKLSIEKLGNADALAYPCGDSNDNAISIVREAGFNLAFTTAYGKASRGLEKLALPRVRMNDGISLDSFIGSL